MCVALYFKIGNLLLPFPLGRNLLLDSMIGQRSNLVLVVVRLHALSYLPSLLQQTFMKLAICVYVFDGCTSPATMNCHSNHA
jgi:hypothetical protein